jgi:membrane fusion protein
MADITASNTPTATQPDTIARRGPLFRPQSLRSHELSWQGQSTLALGLPAAFTSLAAVALALAAAALVVFGSYARRVDMQGIVLPSAGLIIISAPSAGWIEELAVREGEIVAKGAALYTLDLDTATKSGSTQQAIIKVLTGERAMLVKEMDRKIQMSDETKRKLEQKVENLTAQSEELDEQLVTQRKFFKIISDEYNLFEGLLGHHQVSLNEVTSRRQAWMQSQSKMQELESAKLRLIGDLNEANYQLATLAITTSSDIDALKAKVLEIDEKLANSEAHRSIEIRAPGAGIVTAIVGYPGQTVSTGAPMLKIVPQDATMQAELLAPSSAIGFIHPGDRVLLRYSAFPYQKFGEHGGTVTSISQAALSPAEVESLQAGTSSGQQTAPFYRVVVTPDEQLVKVHGEQRALPASMQVQAYALLDRRPLYQWIVAPLFDLTRAARRQ